MKSKDTGNLGEKIASDFLVKKGFTLLFHNWRYKQYEIDLIAQKENRLHIIEVKTRNGGKFGLPEESISTKKMNALKKAAAIFLELNTAYKQLQIDVIAIMLHPGKAPEIMLIEDVFF